MAASPDDQAFVNPGGATRLRPFRLLPGGAQAIPEEVYAGSIVLGSLLVLWLMRRNLSNESAHVHVGGSAAITFLLYYLILTAILRVIAGNLADRGDTSFARGVAFFA